MKYNFRTVLTSVIIATLFHLSLTFTIGYCVSNSFSVSVSGFIDNPILGLIVITLAAIFIYKKLTVNDNQVIDNEQKKVNSRQSTLSATNNKGFNSPWLDAVNGRVNVMPLTSNKTELVKRLYGRTGMGVKELGIMHFGEYVGNQFKIPEHKREHVALNRIKGFNSIKDHVYEHGTREQKFHLDASIIGAEMYAESIGINIKNYTNEPDTPILAKMDIDQRFAVFFVLINIANSDGITDEENDVLAYAINELDIIAGDYNESKLDGNQACDLLQNLNDEQKKRISELIAIVVGADSKFSSQEMIWVNDIIKQIGLDDQLMVDLSVKYFSPDTPKEEAPTQAIPKEDKLLNYIGFEGLERYLNERPNLTRIFDALNFSLHKGGTVKDHFNKQIETTKKNNEQTKIIIQGFTQIGLLLETVKDLYTGLRFKDPEMPDEVMILLHPDIKSALKEAVSILEKKIEEEYYENGQLKSTETKGIVDRDISDTDNKVSNENKFESEMNANSLETISEILEFLNANKDVQIRVEAKEYWDGYYQLDSAAETDGLKHVELYDDAGDEIISFEEKDGIQIVIGDYSEGYNIRKKTYNEEICIWARGFVRMDLLLVELNRFIECDQKNAHESINEFFDFIDIPQDSYEVMELFEVNDDISGAGSIMGKNEFSWHAESYVKSAEVNLFFCK